MRRFYLHRRGKIWYAELIDQKTGIKLPAKSTGKDIRDEALMVVMGLLENGLPVRSPAGNREGTRVSVFSEADSAGPVFSVPLRTRAVSDSLALATILVTIRKTNLAISDAERIGALLVEKNLFTSFIPKDSGASEPFGHFNGTMDSMHAALVAAMFGHLVRHCAVEWKWYFWGGGRWERDDTGKIYALIESAALVQSIQIAPGEFDRDPLALNVENGVLDLETGALHRSDAERMGDNGRYVGAGALYPAGSGANGKSPFINMIAEVLGDYVQSTPVDTFTRKSNQEIPNDLARLIPLSVTIPYEERDAHLVDRLRKEKSGILNWMLEKCLLWQKKRLGVPAEIRSATEAYRDAMDVTAHFLAEVCSVDAETGSSSVKAGLLYAAYGDWCLRNGEKADSQAVVSGRLEGMGLMKHRTSEGRFWKGIDLKKVSGER